MTEHTVVQERQCQLNKYICKHNKFVSITKKISVTVYILYHSPAYLVCLNPWLKGWTQAINQKCVG